MVLGRKMVGKIRRKRKTWEIYKEGSKKERRKTSRRKMRNKRKPKEIMEK